VLVALALVAAVLGGAFVGHRVATLNLVRWFTAHPEVAHVVALALYTDAAVAKVVARFKAQHEGQGPAAHTHHTR